MSDDVVAFGSPGDWEYLEGAYAEIRALLEERNLSLAADRCGRLLQDYPDEADAHALMGDICAARQQWAEAVEWYALAEQRGAGPEVSRRRAAAEAMVPRPVPTPSLPQPTPDLHRQRTRILAIFGAATAVVIVAVPVSSDQAAEMIGAIADELIALLVPRTFFAVGAWYDDFGQTSDEEVRELLRRAAYEAAPEAHP